MNKGYALHRTEIPPYRRHLSPKAVGGYVRNRTKTRNPAPPLKKRNSHVGAITIALRCREAWAITGRNRESEAVRDYITRGTHIGKHRILSSAIQTAPEERTCPGISRTAIRVPAQRGEVCGASRSSGDAQADAGSAGGYRRRRGSGRR